MAIYDAYSALMHTPGGDDVSSASLTWRFPRGVDITAQAAINGLGFSDGYSAEFGFSAYVQSGQYHTIPRYTGVFFMNDVTELEVSAWSFEGWVGGGAMALLWN